MQEIPGHLTPSGKTCPEFGEFQLSFAPGICSFTRQARRLTVFTAISLAGFLLFVSKFSVLNPSLSLKLRRLSIIGMLSVVYVHAFNFDDRYLWAGRPFFEEMDFWNFTQVFITNGLLRFGIPLFFFRSGMLMVETETRYTPLARLKKRSLTLLLPYFAWGFLGIALTWCLEINPEWARFPDFAHLRPFDNLPVHEWSPAQWRDALLFHPVSFQLWFLRSLFVYSALYPLLRIGMKKIPWVLLSVFGIAWLLSIQQWFLEGEGLLFFSLGIWMASGGFDPEKVKNHLLRYRYFWFLPVLLLGKTWLGFEANWERNDLITMGYFAHKLCQPLLMAAVWFGYDATLAKWKTIPLDGLSKYNFFVYGLHVPLVYYANDFFMELLGTSSGMRFAIFLLLPLMISMLAIVLGWLLEKGFRPLFWVLTGGRNA